MITLPKLNYGFDALEPYIDKQTVEIHYAKHHQAYADKLNAALAGTGWEEKPLEEIIKNLSKLPVDKQIAIRNNAGGVFNHNLYWQIMAPKGTEFKGEIKTAIESSWGNLDKFKEEFSAAGLNRFGSGWAWLVFAQGKLVIESTANQDNPLMAGKTAILGLDVWEHAYYILYKWERAKYIENWWNVVNWEAVGDNYLKCV